MSFTSNALNLFSTGDVWNNNWAVQIYKAFPCSTSLTLYKSAVDFEIFLCGSQQSLLITRPNTQFHFSLNFYTIYFYFHIFINNPVTEYLIKNTGQEVHIKLNLLVTSITSNNQSLPGRIFGSQKAVNFHVSLHQRNKWEPSLTGPYSVWMPGLFWFLDWFWEI